MESVFLGLGSNLGDRKANLLQALLHIASEAGHLTDISSLYATDPWGQMELKPFLNMVCSISTILTPDKILEKIGKIEKTMGRQEGKGDYIDRKIDVDILFFGSQIIRIEGLLIPHPRIQERNFVLVPLAEMNRELIHPVLGVSAEQMLWNSSDPLSVKKYRDRTLVKTDLDQLFSENSVVGFKNKKK